MGLIIGYKKEKKIICQLRNMLHNAEKYRECGIRIPRGLLLTGEPGVGKTVMARSLADNNISLVELRAATCCDDEAAEKIKEVFCEAKEKAPSVLLLDELDKIAGMSQAFFMEDNDRVMKTLLQELDNLSCDDFILVAATCNDINMINDALVRPGRFDRTVTIELPDEETRKNILEAYFKMIKIPCELDFDYISRITYGYTGAKLECLANEAGIIGLEKPNPIITQDDVNTIINRMDFMSEEKSALSDKEQLRRVAIHEAGHALTALYLTPNCLFGASVLPQGESQGHIRFVREENILQSVSEIENEAVVMLAGHVAERINLGEYLTGSGSDIEKATMRMHFLVTREAAYGYDYATCGIVRGRESFASDKTKTCASEMITKRLNEIDKKAEELIRKHKDVYDGIVEALMQKQILTREELIEIKNNLINITA